MNNELSKPRFGWLGAVLEARSRARRVTSVADLSPRILNDIGLHQGIIDSITWDRR